MQHSSPVETPPMRLHLNDAPGQPPELVSCPGLPIIFDVILPSTPPLLVPGSLDELPLKLGAYYTITAHPHAEDESRCNVPFFLHCGQTTFRFEVRQGQLSPNGGLPKEVEESLTRARDGLVNPVTGPVALGLAGVYYIHQTPTDNALFLVGALSAPQAVSEPGYEDFAIVTRAKMGFLWAEFSAFLIRRESLEAWKAVNAKVEEEEEDLGEEIEIEGTFEAYPDIQASESM